jgi:membrane protein DedA with SNARE-associated domain
MEKSKRKRNNKRLADLRGLFTKVTLPGVLLITMVVFVAIYRMLGLPSPEEFLSIAKHFYEDYGILVVFLAAVVEGILGVNWYLPGSAIVALGVILHAGDPLGAILVIIVASIGFLVAYILDYYIGKFALYSFLSWLGIEGPLRRMRGKLEAKGPQILLSACIHPNIGALAATSAGILRVQIWRFMMLITAGILFWNAIWGVLVYFMGEVILEVAGMWILVGLAAAWFAWALIRWWFGHPKAKV